MRVETDRLDIAPFLAEFVPSKDISHLFAAHTAVAKNVFPRVAGIMDKSMVRTLYMSHYIRC